MVNEKTQDLRRLQAQRNELNMKVRLLKEEINMLHEQGSYVGEVVRAMDKKKVLVKVRFFIIYISFFKFSLKIFFSI